MQSNLSTSAPVAPAADAEITVSRFDGGKTDTMPAGTRTYSEGWAGLVLDIADNLLPRAPGLEKGIAGYITGCTFRPGNADWIESKLEPRRKQRAERKGWVYAAL